MNLTTKTKITRAVTASAAALAMIAFVTACSNSSTTTTPPGTPTTIAPSSTAFSTSFVSDINTGIDSGVLANANTLLMPGFSGTAGKGYLFWTTVATTFATQPNEGWTPDTQQQLWVSNNTGTATMLLDVGKGHQITSLVGDARQGSTATHIYFIVDAAKIYVSDGTVAGTGQILDSANGVNIAGTIVASALGNDLFYQGSTAISAKIKLYRYHPTNLSGVTPAGASYEIYSSGTTSFAATIVGFYPGTSTMFVVGNGSTQICSIGSTTGQTAAAACDQYLTPAFAAAIGTITYVDYRGGSNTDLPGYYGVSGGANTNYGGVAGDTFYFQKTGGVAGTVYKMIATATAVQVKCTAATTLPAGANYMGMWSSGGYNSTTMYLIDSNAFLMYPDLATYAETGAGSYAVTSATTTSANIWSAAQNDVLITWETTSHTPWTCYNNSGTPACNKAGGQMTSATQPLTEYIGTAHWYALDHDGIHVWAGTISTGAIASLATALTGATSANCAGVGDIYYCHDAGGTGYLYQSSAAGAWTEVTPPASFGTHFLTTAAHQTLTFVPGTTHMYFYNSAGGAAGQEFYAHYGAFGTTGSAWEVIPDGAEDALQKQVFTTTALGTGALANSQSPVQASSDAIFFGVNTTGYTQAGSTTATVTNNLWVVNGATIGTTAPTQTLTTSATYEVGTFGSSSSTAVGSGIAPSVDTQGTCTASTPVTLGSYVYFVANDGQHGCELWKSNGTASGTSIVSDILSGPAGSNPTNLTVVGSYIYFTAQSTLAGAVALYVTDGTTVTAVATTATVALGTATEGTVPANIGGLTSINGGVALVFYASNGTNTQYFWAPATAPGSTPKYYGVNDSTTAAALVAKTTSPVVYIGNVVYVAAAPTANATKYKLQYFTVASTYTSQLSATNITDLSSAAGTDDVIVLANQNVVSNLGVLFFSGTDNATGNQLYKSTGVGGTVTKITIFDGNATQSATPTNFVASGGNLYFTATDVTGANADLWVLTGSAFTTATRLTSHNANNSAGIATVGPLTPFGSKLIFSMSDTDTGAAAAVTTGLYITDGTVAGTKRLVVGSNTTGWVVPLLNNGTATGSYSWSNAQTSSRVLFVDTAPYTSAGSASTGYRLWATDGTQNNTGVVTNLSADLTNNDIYVSNAGTNVSDLNNAASVGGYVVLPMYTRTLGSQLYYTDGTAANTGLIGILNYGDDQLTSPPNNSDLNTTGITGANPKLLGYAGSNAVYTAHDSVHGRAIYTVHTP